MPRNRAVPARQPPTGPCLAVLASATEASPLTRRAAILSVLLIAGAALATVLLLSGDPMRPRGGAGTGSSGERTPGAPSDPGTDRDPIPAEGPHPAGNSTGGGRPAGTEAEVAFFAGVVVDAKTGKPIEDATVSAAASGEDPAGRPLVPGTSGRWGDDGEAAASDVGRPPPGATVARTGRDGQFRLVWTAGRAADLVARKEGYGFGIAAGATPGEPIEIRLEPGEAIRGRLRRRDGGGVGGAIVTLKIAGGDASEAGRPVSALVTDRDGNFEFRGLTRRPYVLSVRHSRWMPLDVDPVEPSDRPLPLILEPARRVWLLVRADGLDGIPEGATASWGFPTTPWRTGRESLHPASEKPPREAPSGAVWASLRVPVEDLASHVTVAAPGFRAWTSPPLAPGTGDAEREFDVRLERDPTVGALIVEVDGGLEAAIPPAERVVVARVWTAEGSPVGELERSRDGRTLVLRGLPAGTYRLSLAGPTFAPVETEATVERGRETDVRVRLPPTARLVVRAEIAAGRRLRFRVLKEGRPVAPFVETERGARRGDGDPPTFLGGPGGVALTGLAGGEHVVEAVTPGASAEAVTVTLVAGEAREVTVRAGVR